MTPDTQRSRAFYCELFGWTADEPNAEFGGYFNFRKDGVVVAGCMACDSGNPCRGLPHRMVATGVRSAPIHKGSFGLHMEW